MVGNKIKSKIAIAIAAIVLIAVGTFVFQEIQKYQEVFLIRSYILDKPYMKFLDMESEEIGTGECYIHGHADCTKVEYDIADENCKEARAVFQKNTSGETEAFHDRIIAPLLIEGDIDEEGYCFARFFID
jgi:hypothetical protein